MDKTHSIKHEKDVASITTTLQNMVNPFKPGRTDMVHLTSGAVATEDVKHDLLTARQYGEEQFKDFVNNRMLVPEPDIFSTIKML